MRADTMQAPRILPPHSDREDVDVLVPIDGQTYADIMELIRAGVPLRVQINFEDGTPEPVPVIECFVFRLTQDKSGGTSWISNLKECAQ